MRVVHLADYGGPYAGSFVPMLRAAARAAAARGWSFECVFTPVARGRPWLPELDGEGIAVSFLAGSAEDHVDELVRATREPVVLHTHFTAFDRAAARAARRHAHVRTFWHLHTVLSPEPAVRARNMIKLAWLSRGVERIVCVSPALAAQARRRGAPASKLTVVANGIDTRRFTPPAEGERHAARERLGMPDGAAVLLHFGWSWRLKGGPLFLDAVRRLSSERPVVGATVGGGEDARAAVAEHGLDAVVRVLEPEPEVRRLYAAADVFVAASEREGMPFAVAEALSCGLPVVATDIPGHVAVGAGMPNCAIVAADGGALAGAIGDALDQPPDSLARRSLDTRALVRTTFGVDRWAERLMDLYAGTGAGPRRIGHPSSDPPSPAGLPRAGR